MQPDEGSLIQTLSIIKILKFVVTKSTIFSKISEISEKYESNGYRVSAPELKRAENNYEINFYINKNIKYLNLTNGIYIKS